jgi:hypothetical protein
MHGNVHNCTKLDKLHTKLLKHAQKFINVHKIALT